MVDSTFCDNNSTEEFIFLNVQDNHSYNVYVLKIVLSRLREGQDMVGVVCKLDIANSKSSLRCNHRNQGGGGGISLRLWKITLRET